MININEMKEKYVQYGQEKLEESRNQGLKTGADISLKIEHGLSMSDAVGEATRESGFLNPSYEESGRVDGLLHDIGRFEQYRLSGTLKDADSVSYTGFADHGQFGAHLLTQNNAALLRHFLGDYTEYDRVLTEVVKEHTTIVNPNYMYSIENLTNLFQNYDIKEIITGNNEEMINKLIALKLLLVREEDSLEILHKVRDGLWKPAIGSEEKYHVKDPIWDTFTQFGYLNMAELKQQGLWNCNAGFLLRYGLLLRNINLVGTLKAVLDDDLIGKVYQQQINNVTNDNDELVTDPALIDKRLYEAYQYTLLAVQNLIATSKDGKIITPESREEAKQKTLRTFR